MSIEDLAKVLEIGRDLATGKRTLGGLVGEALGDAPERDAIDAEGHEVSPTEPAPKADAHTPPAKLRALPAS